ncbi:peptidyl-tRNA hydrolase [Cenarchaeum symbiosum A]|uniref:Peptidyl-tRNA hydrolase n=1 Tax=Cenarchaeum symbiosum (strain A) TaxID=414004 RepID=A0RUY5_CENSY|nr:peptidyl-tRNA hydrolase [Cenarchaeum symbiosum A]
MGGLGPRSYLTQLRAIPCMSPIKQVVAVRTDLGMGKGKIAAQVGHACVMGAERVRRSHPEWFELWWPRQEKVVVRVRGPVELEEIKKMAASLGIPWSEVSDAGHTQVEPGTITCISIGPAPESMVDRVTGDMKLL